MQPADAAETMLLIISMQNQLADAERRERRIRAFQDPGSDDEAIKDLDWKWNPDAREWLHVTGVAVFRYGAHWAWNGQRYGLVYDAMNAAVPGSV